MAVAVTPSSAQELISDLINESLDNGDIVPAIEARAIALEMETAHPEEWQLYLTEVGYRLVYSALRAALGSRRQHARQHRDARVFGEMVAEGVASSALDTWRCRINNDNVQRCIGDMNANDHTFVADSYDATAQESAMLSAFHRAVAKRIGTKTTREVFSDESLTALFNSIAKR